MRRIACCTLLLLAPLGAWAMEPTVDATHGGCAYGGTAAHGDSSDGSSTQTAHGSTSSKQGTTTSSAGGNDNDLLLPRLHMPRWHSFLPGMFR